MMERERLSTANRRRNAASRPWESGQTKFAVTREEQWESEFQASRVYESINWPLKLSRESLISQSGFQGINAMHLRIKSVEHHGRSGLTYQKRGSNDVMSHILSADELTP